MLGWPALQWLQKLINKMLHNPKQQPNQGDCPEQKTGTSEILAAAHWSISNASQTCHDMTVVWRLRLLSPCSMAPMRQTAPVVTWARLDRCVHSCNNTVAQ